MKIVLDINILISATLWEGSVAQKVLSKCIEQEIKIYTSKEILLEYEKVLIRDFKYSKKEVISIIKYILEYIELATPKEQINIIKDDPADNKIIECAVETSAEFIITYDKHLLKILEYKNIKIITPEEFRKI